MHSSGICLILVGVISIINAIPTSLVADLKSGNFVPKNKVSNRNIQEFVSDNGVLNSNNHIAIKRGGNNKFHNDPAMSPRLSNFLYKNYHNAEEDSGAASPKSLKDYEKAFQYGSSKDRLEQDVENAILKSEMYDIPSAPLNYYRYYDDNAQRNNRLSSNDGYRNKRDTKLTSEEIIRLLSILENKFQHNPSSWGDNFDDSNNYYRPRYEDNRPQLQLQHQRLPAWYQQRHEDSNTRDEDEEEDEQWLQEAVPYPHEVEMNDVATDYGYGYPNRQSKRNLYGFANNYGSHFRQANNYQKRYNNNDYYNYYLSELMRSQQEPVRSLKKRQAL